MVSREQELNIIEETKLLVDLFLETNLSDIELSKKTGISSSTVGRRLSNKDNYLKAFPTNGEELYERVMTNRQNNLKMAKTIGGQSSILNNIQLRDRNGQFIANVPKLRLDIFCKNHVVEDKMLYFIALTFRAKLPLLSELFGMEEEIIYTKLCETYYKLHNIDNHRTIDYLCYVDPANQDEARINIITYYQNLLNAIRSKDHIMRKMLLESIDDTNVKKIKDRQNIYLRDEDIEEIIKYQLKYAFDCEKAAAYCGVNASTYRKRLNKYLDINPELKERYEYLAGYNQDVYWYTNANAKRH